MFKFNCSPYHIIKYVYKNTDNMYKENNDLPPHLLAADVAKYFNISNAIVLEEYLQSEIKQNIILIDKSTINYKISVVEQKTQIYLLNCHNENIKYFKDLLVSKISDIIVAFVTSVITCANWEHIVNFINTLFKK